MNQFHWTHYLLSAAELAIILPGALICACSVQKWLAVSLKKVLAFMLPLLTAVCFLCAFLGSGVTIHSRFFLNIIIVINFLSFLFLVRLEKSKLLYVYLSMLALMSFGDLASQMMESFLNPNLPHIYLPRAGLIVQWCFSGLALLYFFLTRKHQVWMLENFHTKSIWRIVWTMPAVILLCNLMMASMNPAILLRYRLFRVYLSVTGALSFLFATFQLLFYRVAKASAEKAEAEKLNRLFEAQNHQYESLQTYIEQTNQLQHDLKHVVRTIKSLADAGQYDELVQFTDQYEQNSRTIFAPPAFFCPHVTLNALLGYYALRAKEKSIEIDWKMDIPAQLPISDVDLNMIFGNLLDNALKACETLPEAKRRICLTADRNTPGCLYIIMVNTFDGQHKHLRRHHEHKPLASGHGIGLVSVIATAEKYDGVAQFYAEGSQFYSNVMLRLPPLPVCPISTCDPAPVPEPPRNT